MLTDQELELKLAEAFREAAGPPSGQAAGRDTIDAAGPDTGRATEPDTTGAARSDAGRATGRGAFDAAGIFRRGVARRRRQVVVRTAGVVAAAALVAGGLGGYLATGRAATGGRVATGGRTAAPGHKFAAPGLLLDAAVARPQSVAAAEAGMPRYYVIADHDWPVAEVRASATGRLLSTVRLPSSIDPKLSQIAAAPGGRTFVLTLFTLSGTRFYRLTLGPGGRSGRLAVLPVPVLPPGEYADGLAVSPDGSKLAVAIQRSEGERGAIEVATLHAGRFGPTAVHTWAAPWRGVPTQLSWARQGRELGFFWEDDGPSASPAAGLWALDATDGGRLMSPRRILPEQVGGDGVQSATLDPDGNTVTATVNYEGIMHVARGTVIGGIVRISVRTGRPLSTLLAEHAAYSADPGGAGWYITNCQLATPDASGRHLLVSCDRFGRLDLARFTPLPGSAAQTAVAAAW